MLRNRIVFTVCLMVSVAIIIGYKGSNIGFVLLYTLSVLLLLAIVSILLAPIFIKTTESVDNIRAAKNTNVRSLLDIKNKGIFLYPNVKLVFYNSDIVDYSTVSFNNQLVPFNNNQLEYIVSAPYRGIYRSGVKDIIVIDFLGLFSRKIASDNIVMLTIYPQYDKTLGLPIINEAQRPDTAKNYINPEDNTAVADIRQYQSSDSPKQIHWKLSAKKGELLTKEYSPLITQKIALFLDTRKAELEDKARYRLEDGMISHLMSGVNYCIDTHLHATLVLGNDLNNTKAIDSQSQLGDILGDLAKVKLEEKYSTVESLLYLPRDHNHVIYLTYLDTNSYAVIEQLSTYENRVIVYYFCLAGSKIAATEAKIIDSLKESNVELSVIEVI